MRPLPCCFDLEPDAEVNPKVRGRITPVPIAPFGDAPSVPTEVLPSLSVTFFAVQLDRVAAEIHAGLQVENFIRGDLALTTVGGAEVEVVGAGLIREIPQRAADVGRRLRTDRPLVVGVQTQAPFRRERQMRRLSGRRTAAGVSSSSWASVYAPFSDTLNPSPRRAMAVNSKPSLVASPPLRLTPKLFTLPEHLDVLPVDVECGDVEAVRTIVGFDLQSDFIARQLVRVVGRAAHRAAPGRQHVRSAGPETASRRARTAKCAR